MTPEGYYNPVTANYYYYLKDHLGNNRVTYHYSGSVPVIDQEVEYYPFGSMFAANNLQNNLYLYNGKELNNEFFENYDYGARFYDPQTGRWHVVDPLAEKYYPISPYAYVANNPIIFIDPDGIQIVGVTRDDARKMHEDLNTIFAGEQFDAFRSAITRSGRRGDGNTFNKIGTETLEKALSGLDGDDLALAQMVAGAINSTDIHKIEYLSGDFTSSEGASAFRDYMNSVQDGVGDRSLTPSGSLHVDWIKSHGDGLNVPTKNGSHSFVVSQSKGTDRAIISGHEVFGHGIPSARKLSHAENNANAIRAENLMRRVLGLPQIDGSRHGGYREGHITKPYSLPIIK